MNREKAQDRLNEIQKEAEELEKILRQGVEISPEEKKFSEAIQGLHIRTDFEEYPECVFYFREFELIIYFIGSNHAYIRKDFWNTYEEGAKLLLKDCFKKYFNRDIEFAMELHFMDERRIEDHFSEYKPKCLSVFEAIRDRNNKVDCIERLMKKHKDSNCNKDEFDVIFKACNEYILELYEEITAIRNKK